MIFCHGTCLVISIHTHVNEAFSSDQNRTSDSECDLLFQMDLRRGDIPTSVKTIFISQLESLTIETRTVYNAHSLRNFTLHNVTNVIVETDGLNLHKNSTGLSFSAIGIHNVLRIDEHAFSGQWKDAGEIVLKNITKLDIADRGFAFTTPPPGLSRLQVQNVADLEVASGAFHAFIYKLELDSVDMQECDNNTFTEKIDGVVLNHVTIPEVEAQCFHNVGQLGEGLGRGVFIRSSSLGNVRAQAFSGNISELLLKNTEVDTVLENGIQVHVKRFDMVQCNIGTLRSRGLAISATQKLSINHVTIKHLLKNAFLGVGIISAPRRYPTVNLDRLDIEYAEAGSLSLSPCLPMDVSKLHIQGASDSERCPTDKWARKLLGADDQRPLSTAEFKVFLSLSELDHSCDETEETLPDRVDEDECLTSDDARKLDSEDGGNQNAKGSANPDKEDGDKQEEEGSSRQEKHVSYKSSEDASDEDEVKATGQPDGTEKLKETGKSDDFQPDDPTGDRDGMKQKNVDRDKISPKTGGKSNNNDGVKREEKQIMRPEKDPFDVSYEYDVYWSDEDEDTSHSDEDDAAANEDKLTSSDDSGPHQDGVNNIWRTGTLILIAISVGLILLGGVLWWRRRQLNRPVAKSDDNSSRVDEDSDSKDDPDGVKRWETAKLT